MVDKFAALLTCIQIPPLVGSFVCSSGTKLTECFPKLLTYIGFLPIVKSLMRLQAMGLADRFPTQLTYLSFFSVWDSRSRKCGLSAELLNYDLYKFSPKCELFYGQDYNIEWMIFHIMHLYRLSPYWEFYHIFYNLFVYWTCF